MERIKLLLLSTVITKREKTQASAFSKGIGLYFLSVETSGYGSQAVRLGKDSLQVKRTFSYRIDSVSLHRNSIVAVFLFSLVEIL